MPSHININRFFNGGRSAPPPPSIIMVKSKRVWLQRASPRTGQSTGRLAEIHSPLQRAAFADASLSSFHVLLASAPLSTKGSQGPAAPVPVTGDLVQPAVSLLTLALFLYSPALRTGLIVTGQHFKNTYYVLGLTEPIIHDSA